MAKYLRDSQGEAGFVASLGILTRTLHLSRDDVQSAISVARLINQLTKSSDGKALQVCHSCSQFYIICLRSP